jgi:hypothetical protein
MPAWKVMFIGLLACICFSLGLATLLVLLTHEGNQRWLWVGGLLPATIGAGGLFTLFLRHASRSLDARARGTRY